MITHERRSTRWRTSTGASVVGPEDRVLGLSKPRLRPLRLRHLRAPFRRGTLVAADHGAGRSVALDGPGRRAPRVDLELGAGAAPDAGDYLLHGGPLAARGAGVSSLRLALVSGDWIPVHLARPRPRPSYRGSSSSASGERPRRRSGRSPIPSGTCRPAGGASPTASPLTNQSFHVPTRPPPLPGLGGGRPVHRGRALRSATSATGTGRRPPSSAPRRGGAPVPHRDLAGTPGRQHRVPRPGGPAGQDPGPPHRAGRGRVGASDTSAVSAGWSWSTGTDLLSAGSPRSSRRPG